MLTLAYTALYKSIVIIVVVVVVVTDFLWGNGCNGFWPLRYVATRGDQKVLQFDMMHK